MHGFLGVHTAGDVLLGKTQTEAVVQQTADAVEAAVIAITGSSPPGTLSTAQTSAVTSWLAFYKQWTDFETSGVSPGSQAYGSGAPLWIPDEAEWAILTNLQTQLAAQQVALAAAFPTGGVPSTLAPSVTGLSFGSFYPFLSAELNATLTSLTYVAGALAAFYYLGPVLLETSAVVGSAEQELAWSPSPRAPTRRKT